MPLPLRFSARIIKGAGRGKVIGTPTLNLDLRDVPVELEHGIYACYVDIPELEVERLLSAVHYGPRPVFKDDQAFEVHLLDTILQAPPEKIIVDVISHLRAVKNFPSIEDLQRQIADDIRRTRDALR